MTPEILAQHAMTLAQQNRGAEAVGFFTRALQLRPDDGGMHHNLGAVLHQIGRLEEAVASYDRALRTRPDAGTYYNRGNALVQLRRTGDAIASYDQALKRAPNNVQALMNRGFALMRDERPQEARADYARAVQLAPDNADAQYNHGLVLSKLGLFEEAVASHDTVLRLKPDHAAACNDRGDALMTLKRPAEALASFERALRLRPEFADAWYNRGVAQTKLGQLHESVESFERASQIESGNLAALALKSYQQAKICDWASRAQDTELLRRGIHLDGAEPFLALALDDDPANQLARSRKWAEKLRTAARTIRPKGALRPERLRIGYFSADFRNHAVMHLTAGLFEKHDRRRFEVHLFSFGEDSQDDMRQRAMAAADCFHDVHTLSDGEIVALARAKEIDIAIDLMGYTRGSRVELFAHRVAPLQVSYLGFPGTLGADFIDYVIADKWVVPEAERQFFTEQVIHLPHAYLANDNQRPISDRVFTRAELGLPQDGFVFCCFNNSYKISPAEFDIWMRLLAEVEGSVLWLLKDNDWAAGNLAREAQARGIEPDRLVFADRMAHADHLARHRCADLFLDTFNYNAHTTASDALWAGLPLVTRPGRSFAARVATSLLNAIGLPELVTGSDAAYEQLALELATDPARLNAIKKKLAANRLTTPLFDTDASVRAFEDAYDGIYGSYLDAAP